MQWEPALPSQHYLKNFSIQCKHRKTASKIVWMQELYFSNHINLHGDVVWKSYLTLIECAMTPKSHKRINKCLPWLNYPDLCAAKVFSHPDSTRPKVLAAQPLTLQRFLMLHNLDWKVTLCVFWKLSRTSVIEWNSSINFYNTIFKVCLNM